MIIHNIVEYSRVFSETVMPPLKDRQRDHMDHGPFTDKLQLILIFRVVQCSAVQCSAVHCTALHCRALSPVYRQNLCRAPAVPLAQVYSRIPHCSSLYITVLNVLLTVLTVPHCTQCTHCTHCTKLYSMYSLYLSATLLGSCIQGPHLSATLSQHFSPKSATFSRIRPLG